MPTIARNPSTATARLLADARRLEESERWPESRLRELQAMLAGELLRHATSRVPYYRGRAAEIPATALPGSDAWLRIPLLTRQSLLLEASSLRSQGTQGRGPVYKVSTSGSTGEPVQVLRTDAARIAWEATALREHRWHGRDARASMAIVRMGSGGSPPLGLRIPRGMPFDRLWRCGPTFALDMTTDVVQQADWLRRVQPNYWLTYPANLAAVLPHLGPGHGLQVEQVIAVGGAVSQGNRLLCREVLGCDVAANYSSQEAGLMALQCPHCRQYHVQSESVILEVLDERGAPCGPGETGRIVVTDLHNYLMPLIRYEIGDYGVVGQNAGCGITLPALRDVLGRRRNMLVHADGRRHWPKTGFAKFAGVAPVLRYQVVQHDLRDVELRVAVAAALTARQKELLAVVAGEALGGDFSIRVSDFVNALPESPSMKFEEFVSHVV